MRHYDRRQAEVKVAVLEQPAATTNTEPQYLAVALIVLSAIIAYAIG